MVKECVWIHSESEEVVPKNFVKIHTNGNCIPIDIIKEVIDRKFPNRKEERYKLTRKINNELKKEFGIK